MKVIKSKTVGERIHRDIHFALAETDEGKLLAFRSASPLFCFEADTLEEAADAAVRAIDSFITLFPESPALNPKSAP